MRRVESQDGGRKDKKSIVGLSMCLQHEEQRGDEKLQERQEEENRRHCARSRGCSGEARHEESIRCHEAAQREKNFSDTLQELEGHLVSDVCQQDTLHLHGHPGKDEGCS